MNQKFEARAQCERKVEEPSVGEHVQLGVQLTQTMLFSATSFLWAAMTFHQFASPAAYMAESKMDANSGLAFY